MMRRSSRYLASCCVIATSRLESGTYLVARQWVVHVVQRCARIAAASPRIHDTRRQGVALLRPGLLSGAGAVAGSRDGGAAAPAGGPPPSRAAAAGDPLRDRPRHPAPPPPTRAADARDPPHHRPPAPTAPSGPKQPQGGSATLGPGG